jgi:hypothetical protein
VGDTVQDIGIDFEGEPVRIIEMTLGICSKPIALAVRRFIPQDGDVVTRSYVTNGVTHTETLTPFCLADVEKTALNYTKYINENAFLGLSEVYSAEPLVMKTFHALCLHYWSMPVSHSPRRFVGVFYSDDVLMRSRTRSRMKLRGI